MLPFLSDEDKKTMDETTSKVNEICHDKEKLEEIGKTIAQHVKRVPQEVRAKVIKENLIILTVITAALGAQLEGDSVSTPAGAAAMSQAMALVFLVGVSLGMEQDIPLPDAFKDAFK